MRRVKRIAFTILRDGYGVSEKGGQGSRTTGVGRWVGWNTSRGAINQAGKSLVMWVGGRIRS